MMVFPLSMSVFSSVYVSMSKFFMSYKGTSQVGFAPTLMTSS